MKLRHYLTATTLLLALGSALPASAESRYIQAPCNPNYKRSEIDCGPRYRERVREHRNSRDHDRRDERRHHEHRRDDRRGHHDDWKRNHHDNGRHLGKRKRDRRGHDNGRHVGERMRGEDLRRIDAGRYGLEHRGNWSYYRDDDHVYRVDSNTGRILSVLNFGR